MLFYASRQLHCTSLVYYTLRRITLDSASKHLFVSHGPKPLAMLLNLIIMLILFQVLNHDPVSLSSDVYSYGMLLFEILTREIPFAGISDTDAMKRIQRGEVSDSNIVAVYKKLLLPVLVAYTILWNYYSVGEDWKSALLC